MLPVNKSKLTPALQDVAGANGFEFIADFDRNELGVVERMDTVDNWQDGANLVSGRHRGFDFQMFDMTQCLVSRNTEGGNTTSYPSKTVFLFPNTRRLTPRLSLMRGHAVFKIVNFAGSTGVAFHAESGYPEEEELLDEFNENYLASGEGFVVDDGDTRPVPEEISLDLVRTLQLGRGWSIEIGESHVAVFVHKTILEPDERLQCLAEAHDLVELLTSGGSSSTRLTMTKLQGVGFGKIIGAMAWVFGGAVCGMILTCLIFFPIVLMSEKPPTAVIFAFPVAGLFLMAGGAFAGLKLGVKFSKSK